MAGGRPVTLEQLGLIEQASEITIWLVSAAVVAWLALDMLAARRTRR